MSRPRYEIVDRIDVGGMAEVFRGKAVSLDGYEKQVAIKRVLPQLAADAKFVNMFLDEARVSLALSHANIVSVFDVSRAGETYFIVME
jgi:serine/threonine-protein kinase